MNMKDEPQIAASASAKPPPAAAPTALAEVLFTPVQQRVLGLLFGLVSGWMCRNRAVIPSEKRGANGSPMRSRKAMRRSRFSRGQL